MNFTKQFYSSLIDSIITDSLSRGLIESYKVSEDNDIDGLKIEFLIDNKKFSNIDNINNFEYLITIDTDGFKKFAKENDIPEYLETHIKKSIKLISKYPEGSLTEPKCRFIGSDKAFLKSWKHERNSGNPK